MNPLQSMAKTVREWFASCTGSPEGSQSEAPRQEQSRPEAPQQVLNVTRGTVLATQLTNAHTGATRRKGLLGRNGLLPGEGLWIAPCEAVHTFFMHFPIDLVYLDRKLKVKKVRHSVAAWRMSACLTAHSVLELPAGTAAAARTERGDCLEITPATAASES